MSAKTIPARRAAFLGGAGGDRQPDDRGRARQGVAVVGDAAPRAPTPRFAPSSTPRFGKRGTG